MPDIKIIAADDDPSLLRLVIKVLEREGFNVEGASSGAEVREKAVSSEGKCLLLLDYDMGDMSGNQIIEDLSSRGYRLPFIIMTGHGDERIAVEMMKLGARDYLMKDVAFVDLLPSVVGQVLEQIKVESRLADTEEGLRKSEEKFAKAFRASPDWVIIMTREGNRIMEVNDSFLEATGYGKDETIGSSCKDMGICSNPSNWKELFDSLARGASVRNKEVTVRAKSGREHEVIMSAEPIDFDGIPCAICIARDITERKRDQEKIMASLREKEVLLKEIHHRVKNNLQVVTSLLNLQAKQLDDPAMAAVFEDSTNRIKSMSLVHEMLYSADDFSRVDFGAYVGALLDNIYRSIRVSRGRVKPELDLLGIRMGIDYAVPCGFIVNELATNAFKYAYTGDREGVFSISMQASEGEQGMDMVMTVSDDGPGLPAGINFSQSDTLGMRLVRLLSEKQLGGRVQCRSSSNGVSYKIEFRMK